MTSDAREVSKETATLERDPLTADPASIPTRRAGPVSLADCARAFSGHASPWIIGAAVVAALGVRVALGGWSWRDVVIPGVIIAAQPLTEWAIHVYLLHARPLRIGAWRLELPSAREHRAHHAAPGELDGVLVPAYGIVIFLPMIAVVVWLLSFPLQAVLGGDRIAGAAIALLASYAILGTYEWCHFLIHTPYRPRRGYYRSIWRSHRLHHYKNERYWFGVTTNLGDRVLGTFPDQATVRKSRTARTLGPHS